MVLRAPLVLGAGDRWVVPCLAELTRRVAGPVGRRRGPALAGRGGGPGPASRRAGARAGTATERVHHAGHPEPVRSGALLDALAEHGVLPPTPGQDWPWERCLAELRRVPGVFSERQFALLAQDHWYRSTEIWRSTGTDPGPGPLHRLAAAAPWYRDHLARTDATATERSSEGVAKAASG